MRLEYSKETQELLEKISKESNIFWRYQDSRHNGEIPQDHRSHERMYSEEPEFAEEGVSCYDNPYQSLDYFKDEFISLDENGVEGYDMIVFSGYRLGQGMDDEDIAEVEEIIYSMSLFTFLQFCKNADEDLYFLSSCNLKELADSILKF